jgi:hypothetical protein
VKLVSAYLWPSRLLNESDLTERLSGGIPVLIAGDPNAKHKHWNSRLPTSRSSLLRDYVDRNSCLIYRPDSPTTAPYTHQATPDVLDIVVVNDFVLPVHLTVCAALSSDHLPILIDTSCRSSFHNRPDRPDFTRMDWAALQTCLEHRLPTNSVVVDEEAIDKCLEELSSAIKEARAASAPRRRPRANPRPPPPASIQDEIRLKKRLRRQWQITTDPALKAQINRLQRSVTWQLNEWRNDQWSVAPESLGSEDQSLWKMKRVMRVPTPSPPLQVPEGLALSDSERAKALVDSLEAQFQPVDDQSHPAFPEMVGVAMRPYEYAPASEPPLTTPSEVIKNIKGLKVSKAPGPNGTPNRVLRHLPKRAVTFLTKVFNAVLRRQYFPPVWKHASVLPF